MINNAIAVIGGSGIYNLFTDNENSKEIIVESKFGNIRVFESNFGSKKVYFLPRHGSSHSIPPHKINFKANIFSLYKLGVKHIIATNAVGSLKKSITPGSFVILDQFIDLTSGVHTFFDGEFEVEIDGKLRSGVQHTDVTEPYSNFLRSKISSVLKTHESETFEPNGCYVMFNGPRFETKAEISMFQQFGDVVGMTGAPEVILSRELNIEYATICLVTNYGAGIQESVNHVEVLELFESKIENFKKIILDVINLI